MKVRVTESEISKESKSRSDRTLFEFEISEGEESRVQNVAIAAYD